ncbi:MAG: glycosyltransferase [Eubacterium sp.]|nr:glycosyltransferase [Eubacterium sp.]
MSVIIVSYNNVEYIYSAIDSILSQSYGNIELIVSDDCSTEYDEAAVRAYVEEKRGTNLRSVKYNTNSKNLGTVAHLERLYPLCTGEIVTLLAADDVLNDEGVVEAAVNAFRETPDVQVLMSNVAMCDETLENVERLFVSEETAALINSGDTEELFRALASKCILPAMGTFYRREVLRLTDGLSKRYKLVEDWPTHIILAREGISFRYIDRVSGRHRKGGISNNKKLEGARIRLTFIADTLRIYDDEVVPYADRLGPEVMEKARKDHAARLALQQEVREKLALYEQEK